ncbi:MAG: DUF4249 domain-containing protein [Bacteroidota bacterium]
MVAFRCEEPVELELDIPEPQMVLLSNFFPDEFVEVQLSATQSILTTGEYTPIEGATVRLLIGDETVEVLQQVEGRDGQLPYYTTLDFQPRAGVRYTIHANASGYVPVSAVSSIPEPVPITSFQQLSSHLDSQEDGSSLFHLSFELDYEDPEIFDDYYHLKLLQEVEELKIVPNVGDTVVINRRLEPILFPFNNQENSWIPAILRSGGGVLIKNKPFDPLLELNVTQEFVNLERPGRLFVELRVVSDDYYNFQSSLSRQRQNGNLPTVDAVEISNNVTNGQGVFAGYNFVRDTLQVNF